MYIKNLFEPNHPVISFEIFPPKRDGDFQSVVLTTKDLAALKPDFISITYGAGGTTRSNTLEVAEHIKKTHEIETLAHLTCIANSSQEIEGILTDLRSRGIKNILALRGDLPQGAEPPAQPVYAKNLISQIKSRGDFSIAAAAYPEGHLECVSLAQDVVHLAEKVQAGADFLITQIFFDNDLLYRFQELAAKQGIEVPLSAGIMPVFARSQIERICSLCGARIPKTLQTILEKYGNNPEDLTKAGLEFAGKQIADLLDNGVAGIHIYTMNKPLLARSLMEYTGRG